MNSPNSNKIENQFSNTITNQGQKPATSKIPFSFSLKRLTVTTRRSLSFLVRSFKNEQRNISNITENNFEKPKAKAKLNPHALLRKTVVCAASLMAILIFAVSLQSFNTSVLALEVELNGRVIGIVESEDVFIHAFEDIYNRIADDFVRDDIEKNVTFSEVRTNLRNVSDISQMQENILNIVLPQLVEVSILRVDGRFIVAAQDDTMIYEALDELLESYDGGEEGVSIQFYNEISISKGFCVGDRLSDDQDIRETLNSPVVVPVDEEVIVVDEPVTVVEVASKTDVCPEVILEINPELRDYEDAKSSEILIDSGTEVVVGYEERPLLTIKTIKNITTKRNIAYETVETYCDSLKVGRSKATQAGKLGVENVIEEVVFVNGVEIERTELRFEVLQEPITRRVTIGTYSPAPVQTTPAALELSPREQTVRMQFSYPVDEVRVSSRWGAGRGHRGWDFLSPIGSNIYSAADGVVSFVGSNRGYGLYIIIDHGDGYSTLYAHNRANLVAVGQRVSRGEKIAEVGMTGQTTGPHVHFEIHFNGSPVNPANYFE